MDQELELCRILPKSYNPVIYIVVYTSDNSPYTMIMLSVLLLKVTHMSI